MEKHIRLRMQSVFNVQADKYQSMVLAIWGLKCDYVPWQSCIHPTRQLLIILTLMQDDGATPTLAALVQTDTSCILTNTPARVPD